MESIPRSTVATLPDFCSQGVALRLLLAGNLGLVLYTLISVEPFTFAAWAEHTVVASVRIEPVLVASMVVLCPLRNWLSKLSYWQGVVLVILIEVALVAITGWLLGALDLGARTANFARDALVAAVVTFALLHYFQLRARAFSPALSEARLMALQARIRPHFLFNSLTAVLSLIRHEPKRAERALEDIADLFRVLLREQRKLVPLHEELDLCRQYLAIEMLRLGERLRVDWQIDGQVRNCALPPLVLQPLVENAVHHGIEPGTEPGTVVIRAQQIGSQVEVAIINPRIEGNTQPPGRTGNHMALDNVRERLALQFDVEARLETVEAIDTYTVRMLLPLREPPQAENK